MSAIHVLFAIGAGLAVWGSVRVVREPRRISTGLILVAAAVFLTLWVVSSLHTVDPSVAAALGVVLFLLLPPLSLLAAGIGLLANGVVLTRKEGLRVATAVAPVAGIGLIALPFLAVLWLSPATAHSAWASALLLLVVLLGLLVLVQLVAFTAYAVLYARLPQPPGADVVVVLGCGLRGDAVTPLLASRLDRAAEVYREECAEGGDPLLVASGGKGPGETVAEADAMADYLAARGIPADRIVRENRSRNTEENLRFTERELTARGIDPAEARMTVVTSDFHVLRTAGLTRRQGLRAQVTGARTARYFVPAAFLREFVAVLVTHRKVNLIIGGVLTALIGALLIISYLPIGGDPGN
ncbi:YdcF family protein [Nocardia yamanashiensis]|uniref:YdcF family protein n=1 Tax=Nocardia yamanashiensis TaxID=209247 RepID=UPI000A054DF2|nr:YdcF family protein [Nocardia yamanashiensis]